MRLLLLKIGFITTAGCGIILQVADAIIIGCCMIFILRDKHMPIATVMFILTTIFDILDPLQLVSRRERL